jgi:hypothetical protein
VRDREFSSNLVSIPWFRSAQFLGTYRGFAQRGEVSAVLRRRFYYPNDPRRRGRGEEVATAGRPIHYEEVLPEQPTGKGS